LRLDDHRPATGRAWKEAPSSLKEVAGCGGTGFTHTTQESSAMHSKYLSTLIAAGSLALAAGNALADDMKSDQPVKDSYITTKVKAELAKDKGTSATDIHVTTKDGVVMLDGTVNSTAEKELAEKDAKKVKGVMGVHNGLTVK